MRKFLFGVISLVAVIAIGAGAYALYQQQQNSESASDIAANDLSNNNAPAAGDDAAPAPTLTKTDTAPVMRDGPQSTPGQPAPIDVNKAAATQNAPEPADATLAKPQDIHITVDGVDPKAPRSIGKLDAPVTMIEFSSLTCPHCAHAHETVLPQLIKDYVQTGKLRIVFSDFPLNQEALDASKVSRCVPNDQYFGFLTILFSTIEQWAYSNNHPAALLQDATLAGLPMDRARACLGDTALEQSIVQGVQEAVAKYHVEATPTFVLNDGKATISGARPYADFKAAIDALEPAAKK